MANQPLNSIVSRRYCILLIIVVIDLFLLYCSHYDNDDDDDWEEEDVYPPPKGFVSSACFRCCYLLLDNSFERVLSFWHGISVTLVVVAVRRVIRYS